MEHVKNAIILAAGQGTRLRPYTDITPKPLLKVHEKPMIENIIEHLHIGHIYDITIVTGYMHEKFEYLKEKYGVNLVYNDKYMTMSNISSLYAVKDLLSTTVIMDGDQIINKLGLVRSYICHSGYTCYWTTKRKNEWGLSTYFGRIVGCNREYAEFAYVLQSMSYWTEEDTAKLKTILTEEFLQEHSDKYWDDIALFIERDQFKLNAFIVNEGDLQEIDTVEEYEEINCETN